MGYISFSYYIFVVILVAVYYVLPKKVRWLVLLVGSGCFYYALAVRRECLLLFGASVLVSFFWGLLLGNRIENGIKSQGIKRLLLAGGIVFSCAPLFCFRLGDFFPGSVFHSLSFQSMIPIGLSFYSMQIIAYLADVYRGDIEPEKNVLKYLLFVSFFPLVIQGPISRLKQLQHQLLEGHSFDWNNIMGGIQLIIWGFFLKFMIADKSAVIVNEIFDHYQYYPGLFVLIGGVLYSIQLYSDFLSCVTLSQGVAQLFGIHVIDNFMRPYFATSLQEFWRRWHMSLSSWLRDYVYIPLGGSRKGKVFQYCNLTIVFVISGLWHGGGWNYLFWGFLHAVYQIAGDLTGNVRKVWFENRNIPEDSRGRRAKKRAVTFFLVMLGWIIFRAESLNVGIRMIVSMFRTCNPWILFDNSLFQMGLVQKEWEVLILAILVLVLVSVLQEQGIQLRKWFARQNLLIRWSIYLCAIWCIWIFGTYGFGFYAQDFIYGGF